MSFLPPAWRACDDSAHLPGQAGSRPTSLSPRHSRCSATGKPVSAKMLSLRSRAVAVAGTATVLQPTQPRSTVTRIHLRQAKGWSAGLARAARPPALPRGGLVTCPPWRAPQAPQGRRLTPSPAEAPRGRPLALTRGSSWRRPAPPQRSAAARTRGREGAVRRRSEPWRAARSRPQRARRASPAGARGPRTVSRRAAPPP